MRALIKVGDRCNQACRFCHRGEPRCLDVPRARVDALIDRAAALGHHLVALSGGEPTLRPELRAWAERAAGRGLDFGLVTNGTLLDSTTIEALLRARLRYVQVSLHGGTAEIHDGIVRAGSFERVRATLRILTGRGLDLWVNCVVARPNLAHLRDVVDAVAPYADAGLKFSLIEPRGPPGHELAALVPAAVDAAARVADALEHARRTLGSARRLAHDGLPLCLVPELADLRGDLRAHGFTRMAEVGEEDLHPVDERNALHPQRCGPCTLRGRCPGLYAGYHARFGDGELRPVRSGARPMSFSYIDEEQVSSSDGCPVEASGIEAWDVARHLFVRDGERVARFRTDTRDFSDVDIARVKTCRGQIYLDRAAGHPPDPTRRALVKLRRCGACVACRHATRCTGLYEREPEDALARDDARVLRILSELDGDVLDVACGEGPYADALAAAATAGRVRYVGLHPDRARASSLAARWPWASVVPGAIEELPVLEPRFDHALVLLSWNRMRDPAVAVARIASVLRGGGSMTVVDDEPFGLVRTRAHGDRLEPPDVRLEGGRNDGAAEADAVIQAAAPELRLLERRDVAPTTGNRWLLRFVRARAAQRSPRDARARSRHAPSAVTAGNA